MKYRYLNCYSFYPTKTLTMDEGGIVTTNDDELLPMHPFITEELGNIVESVEKVVSHYHK